MAYEEALASRVREILATGRPMKGYVYIAAAGVESERSLRRWIGLARGFVEELPPKQKGR